MDFRKHEQLANIGKKRQKELIVLLSAQIVNHSKLNSKQTHLKTSGFKHVRPCTHFYKAWLVKLPCCIFHILWHIDLPLWEFTSCYFQLWATVSQVFFKNNPSLRKTERLFENIVAGCTSSLVASWSYKRKNELQRKTSKDFLDETFFFILQGRVQFSKPLLFHKPFCFRILYNV